MTKEFVFLENPIRLFKLNEIENRSINFYIVIYFGIRNFIDIFYKYEYKPNSNTLCFYDRKKIFF